MNPSSSSSSSSSSLVPVSSCKRKRDPSCYDEDDCCKRPKNDVFMNYSFEDIGNKFVSHLKRTLKHNLFTICDHTMLPIGQDESFELLKAIEESHIYVVVFSINYARSINCLDELVLIKDSLSKFSNRKFFPIFFDVDPSDVRNLRGSFEEAFRTHEADVDPERLLKWKQALEDSGHRSGLTYHKGDETEFIQKIVQELKKIQLPAELFDAEHPVGIEPRAQAIISKLRLGDPDFSNIVAVLGISGSGKTTIVKAVYDKIVADFNFNCFVENICYYKNNGPNWKLELQRGVIHRLTGNDPLHHVGVPPIKKFISGNMVLLVLDNVEKFEELQALGIPSASLGCGSRIIVTTTDKRSLGNLRYTPYDIDWLNTEESFELFVRHAYGEGDDPVDTTFVLQIVRHAEGLPLVLEVWGRLFKCEERRLWGRLFEKLKRIPNEDIQKKLQISYDSLTERAKNLFLDIACFFNGDFERRMFDVLEDQEFSYFPEIEIQPLVDRGLVTIVRDYKVVLHQVIREMGQEVVRQENVEEPGLRTRLVDHRDVLRVLNDYSGTDNVKSIMLDTVKLEKKQYIQVEAFKKMRNLRFIKLVGTENCSYSSSNDDTSLSFKHLKYLEWKCFPCRRINIDMDNVVIIELKHSKLELLWEGFKNLKNLRTLDVTNSNSLTWTGSFIGLENLERLYFSGCKNLEEVDCSIGCLHKLKVLDLSWCIRLKRFPCEVASLKSLDVWNFKGCRIPSLPNRLCQLHQLRLIYFSNCDNIQSIPNLPPNIEDIELNDCKSLVNLPSNMSELQSLSALLLHNCVKLGSECLMKLTGIRNVSILDINNCNISQVPSEIGNLVLLGCLYLSRNTFTSLPDSFCNLSELELLEIEYCSNLQYLPLLPSNLERISACGCWSLDVMPLTSMRTAYSFHSEMFQESLFTTPLWIGLSGTELPGWFSTTYKEKGNVFSFVAPIHLDKKICGAILGATSYLDVEDYPPTILNKTNKTSYRVNDELLEFRNSMKVIFIIFDDTTLVVEAGDTVELQFELNDISSCGLSWIYEGDVVDSTLLIQNRNDTHQHTFPVAIGYECSS